jgi:peptidoglycan/xylan/chitin deacetylase (PgdA/CDA1 family)
MTRVLKTSLLHSVRWAGLTPFFRMFFAGRAAILMFHEVQRDCPSELMTGASIDLFDYALQWLRQEGWRIIGLAECLDRMAEPKATARHAVLTFDDGYRDTVTAALPILERHNAPFMIYVPTGAPTRTLQSWWLGLRELFRSRDVVTIDAMGRRFHCPDLRSKVVGLDTAIRWVHEDYGRTSALTPLFANAGISLSALNERYFLSEQELQTLALNRLASVGGHTKSHVALATLDVYSARTELADNRNYLEGLLQLPVHHLAYPYGGPRACGARERGLANAVGFVSGVTTRHGHLSEPDPDRFALPRIGVGGGARQRVEFEARMNGIQAAAYKLVGNAQ